MNSKSLFELQANSFPQRAWINQPSTLQEHHSLHGKKVITIPPLLNAGDDGWHIQIAFIDGPVTSMIINFSALAKGWNK